MASSDASEELQQLLWLIVVGGAEQKRIQKYTTAI